MRKLLVLAFVGAIAFGAVAQRTGAWVDEVVFTAEVDHSKAILMLEAGDIHLYGFPIVNVALFNRVQNNPNLTYTISYGNYREFSFNPVGPVFASTGKLNPFAVPAIREACNWIIDRDYIVFGLLGGMGAPMYTSFGPYFAEVTQRYPKLFEAVEDYYAYDFDKGAKIIADEMAKLGATLVGGKWHYNGEPVVLSMLIRSDLAPYPVAGDYFADQLEAAGFTTTRLYRTSGEAAPLWQGDPARGLFHVYTGGWGASVFPREQATSLNQMYTPRGMALLLWQAYTPSAALDEAARKIAYREFSTMAEREQIFTTGLWESMKDSVRVWHTNLAGFMPSSKNVRVSACLAGSFTGSSYWPYTLQFHNEGVPQVGGTVNIAMNGLLTMPYNPVEGSSWSYDLAIMRNALGSAGTLTDSNDGLARPLRLEKGEVYVVKGLPVEKSLDWVDLHFVDAIKVPATAWADWDAAKQVWITAAERYGAEGGTARRKSVAYYPKDLWDVPLHDGSKITLADFVLAAIYSFDVCKPESIYFDQVAATRFQAWFPNFKGVEFKTDDPNYALIVTTYYDSFVLDAELSVASWWPTYGTYGCEGFWHNVGLGLLAEAEKSLAFSKAKSDTLGVEWMSYVAGPSLSILAVHLDVAKATGYIPYAPTMSQYVTPAQATERWTNLAAWYAKVGHFWVGSGPFYLEKAFPLEKVVVLKRFEAFPDLADKWLFAFNKN